MDIVFSIKRGGRRRKERGTIGAKIVKKVVFCFLFVEKSPDLCARTEKGRRGRKRGTREGGGRGEGGKGGKGNGGGTSEERGEEDRRRTEQRVHCDLLSKMKIKINGKKKVTTQEETFRGRKVEKK